APQCYYSAAVRFWGCDSGGGRRRDDGVNGDADDGVAAAEVANGEAADVAGMVGIWPEVGRK
ncbi:hypothetical protein Tco_1344892, partial [Tanacetum coccineum]